MSLMTHFLSRFRFSLGSLLIAVTAIGACLGAFQLKSRLLDSGTLIAFARDALNSLPVSSTSTFIVIQIATLCMASFVLFRLRKPGLLWANLAGKTLWVMILVLSYPFQNEFTLPNYILEMALALFFFETTFGLVFAAMAWCQAICQKSKPGIVLVTLVLLLNLLAELCSLVELDSFRGALSAALHF